MSGHITRAVPNLRVREKSKNLIEKFSVKYDFGLHNLTVRNTGEILFEHI